MTTPKRGLQASIVRKLTDVVGELRRMLADIDDPAKRALVANDLTERCRLIIEIFAEERTAAFVQLRDEGWSLGDLAEEFGVTRARAAQISCRDRYKSGESRGGGGRQKT